MNFDLNSELEKLIETQVRSGRYDSVVHVLDEALRLLEQRDHDFTARNEEYRKQIEEGWQAALRGDFVDGDEVFDRIDAELAAAEVAADNRSHRG